MEQLRDIKSSEIIQIDLLPYLLGVIGVILIFVFIVFFFMWNKNKKLSQKQIAKNHLKKLNFDLLDDKQIAYQFCEYGYLCVEDHFADEFKRIEKQLEKFKYKKVIPKMDNELKNEMKDYIRVRL